MFLKDKQYIKFCAYGFLRNLRFFEAFFILFLIGKGSSYTEIGILYAIREITINLFEVPSGIIADTYGRKTALAGSFILYIISFVIFYFSSEFWIFLPAFIFFGIAEAFRTGTHKGMIMTYLAINNWGDQKINYYGHTRSWSQKGAALSSLAAGLIVFYSGDYERIFLYSTIPFVLNFFLILSYPEELDEIPERQKIKHTAKLGITIKSFFKNLIKAEVLKIINMSAFHSAYLKAVKDYIQPLMVNVALLIPIMMNLEPDRKNGIIIGCMYFIIYLLNSFASRLAAKASEGERKKKISYITLLCGFTCGIACGIFYALNLWIISLIAFIGIFFIENLRKPILTGFIADNVSNQVLASVISIESQLKTVITAVIALFFGILADTMGIGKAFIVVTSCLLLFSLLINYSVKAGVFRNRKT